MDRKLGIVIGLLVGAFAALYFILKGRTVEGDTRCEDGNLLAYVEGQWTLVEENSSQCLLDPEPPNPPSPPEPPDENPLGFTIDDVLVTPAVVILGEEANIKVVWFCPNPLLEERDFIITCTIDGLTLQRSWRVRAGNGAINIKYTPESIGVFVATVGDKLCTFQVKEEVIGAFYSPYGGLTIYPSIDALAKHIAANGKYNKQCHEYNCRHATFAAKCPYCSASFSGGVTDSQVRGSREAGKTKAAYLLINHIQVSHPGHPLTIPRCHIVISNIPDLLGGSSRPRPLLGYAVRIDDQSYSYGRHPRPGQEYLGRPYWQMVGYETIYNFLAPNTYKHEEMHEFVTTPGKHHIEVRGPVERSFRWRKDPYETPGIIDAHITLDGIGDYVVCDVGAGTAEVVKWRG